MAQITLKIVLASMAMLVGLAMAIATFITYGKAALRVLTDITGPIACSQGNYSFGVPPVCADVERSAKCHQIFATYTLVDVLQTSLLRPYLSDYNVSATASCMDTQCSFISGDQLSKGGAQLWPYINATEDFDCFVDRSKPGVVFTKLDKDGTHSSSERRVYSRLESIVILSMPSAAVLLIAIGLLVCCQKKLLFSDPVMKEQIHSSYIKIGDKYYTQVSMTLPGTMA